MCMLYVCMYVCIGVCMRACMLLACVYMYEIYIHVCMLVACVLVCFGNKLV